mgnify:CR=1 FL=1
MKAMDIIDRVDMMEPNQYGPEQKLKWLSILDGKVYEEVIRPREEAPAGFAGYETGNEELLIQFPYDYDVYYEYLQAMIEKENGETQRYNRRMILFNNAYTEYLNWYSRNHNKSGVRRGETPKHFLF